MRNFVLAAFLTAALVSPAVAGDFDGTWSVQLVTESGLCEAQYSYTLAVRDGQVRPSADTASGAAAVTGRVGPAGDVGLNVATAAANASASGQLQARSGTGKWRVSGGLCTGRWTARRNTVRTAFAE